jgi:hypothetical protein
MRKGTRRPKEDQKKIRQKEKTGSGNVSTQMPILMTNILYKTVTDSQKTDRPTGQLTDLLKEQVRYIIDSN